MNNTTNFADFFIAPPPVTYCSLIKLMICVIMGKYCMKACTMCIIASELGDVGAKSNEDAQVYWIRIKNGRCMGVKVCIFIKQEEHHWLQQSINGAG